MKKNRVGLLTFCLLAGVMVVQGQPAIRQGRSATPVDTAEQMRQMRRMSPMRGPGAAVLSPVQSSQRGATNTMDSTKRPERMRALRGVGPMRQGRTGGTPLAGMRRMQRGGGYAAHGNSRLQRGGVYTTPGNGRLRQGGMNVMPGNNRMQQGRRFSAPGNVPANGRGGRAGMAAGYGSRRAQQGFRQDGKINPEVRIKAEVDRMDKTLNLSPDQVKKITAIKKKQVKKEIASYKKAQKKAAHRRNKLQSSQDKIKSVLTDEQVKKWESSRSESRPQMGAEMVPGAGFNRSGLNGNRFGGNRNQR